MWSLFSGGYKGTAISNATHAMMEIKKSVMGEHLEEITHLDVGNQITHLEQGPRKHRGNI